MNDERSQKVDKFYSQLTFCMNREDAAKQHADNAEAFSGQNRSNTVGDFVAGCEWEAEHGAAASELSIVQACLCGHLGLPLDTSMQDLLTALRGNPRPQFIEPVGEFYYSGALPEGYEIYMMVTPPEEKVRAQRIDLKWRGPWRIRDQGGLIVGDAWKHVTNAKNAEIDEAGAGC